MKNFFKKIKNYGFWVSLSASIILLLNAFGNAFGFEIQNQIVEDCVMAIAGILVVFGIVVMPSNDKNNKETEIEDDNSKSQSDDSDQAETDANGDC